MVQVSHPPRRRALRLRHHNYAEPGSYFVTICCRDRECLLGDIVDGQMALNAFGAEVTAAWQALLGRFEGVELDACVVMPNHFHGIVTLITAAASLSEIVSVFKSLSAFRINASRGMRGSPVWQRGFYDHVVRDDRDLDRIREYIEDNPARWSLDEENPMRVLAAVP